MYDGDVCKWVRNNIIILMFMKKERERAGSR